MGSATRQRGESGRHAELIDGSVRAASARSRCSDNQDRNEAQSKHVFGIAADEEPPDATPAVGAHDDEVRIHPLDFLEDLVADAHPWIGPDRRVGRNPCGCGSGNGLRHQTFAARPPDVEEFLRSDFRRDFRKQQARVDHVEKVKPGSESLGDPDGLAAANVGGRTAVDRHEDSLVHAPYREVVLNPTSA